MRGITTSTSISVLIGKRSMRKKRRSARRKKKKKKK